MALSQWISILYVIWFRSASFWFKLRYESFSENTRKLKASCSMNESQWLVGCKYFSSYSHCSRKLSAVSGLGAWLFAKELKTLMSKNVRCLLCQKPRALTSNQLASSDELSLLLWTSPFKFSRSGLTSLRRVANRSPTSSCLLFLWTNPLFIHDIAWSTSNCLPQGHIIWKVLWRPPVGRLSTSWNFNSFRLSFFFFTLMVVLFNQLEAPFIFMRLFALSCSSHEVAVGNFIEFPRLFFKDKIYWLFQKFIPIFVLFFFCFLVTIKCRLFLNFNLNTFIPKIVIASTPSSILPNSFKFVEYWTSP